MPKFNLKCIERFIETTYYEIEADTLAVAVDMAVNGDAPYVDSQDVDHEQWLDLLEADKDGVILPTEELHAARAPHKTIDPPALSQREMATILGALRLFAASDLDQAEDSEAAADHRDAATGNGKWPLMTSEEIGALCSRLSCGGSNV